MPKSLIHRKSSYRVRLSEDVSNQLEGISKRLGVPPSTLLAVACGRYVAQETNNMTAGARAIESITEDFKPLMKEALQTQTRLWPSKRKR